MKVYLLYRWKPETHQEPFDMEFLRNRMMVNVVKDDQETTGTEDSTTKASFQTETGRPTENQTLSLP